MAKTGENSSWPEFKVIEDTQLEGGIHGKSILPAHFSSLAPHIDSSNGIRKYSRRIGVTDRGGEAGG